MSTVCRSLVGEARFCWLGHPHTTIKWNTCCCCCFVTKHYLPESAQTHVHWVSDAIRPSHPLSSPSPLALNLSQHQSLFQWVSSSHQVIYNIKQPNLLSHVLNTGIPEPSGEIGVCLKAPWKTQPTGTCLGPSSPLRPEGREGCVARAVSPDFGPGLVLPLTWVSYLMTLMVCKMENSSYLTR